MQGTHLFQKFLKETLDQPRVGTDNQAMAKSADQHDQLLEAQDRFIASWGQMAGAWGISRTMAEAQSAATAMADAFAQVGVEGADTHVSELGDTGAHMIETSA